MEGAAHRAPIARGCACSRPRSSRQGGNKEAANAAADASERSEEESSDEEDDSSDEEDDTEGESAESGEEAADEGSGEEGESAKRQRRQSGDRQTTAEDEAATLQSEFMKAWKEAVKLPAQVVGDRWEQLELKGKRVIVHESAPAEDIAELHAALKELDDAFDPSFSTQADLKKMPVLKELLEDPTHCTNSTYLFELFSCGKEGCKFGCQKWEAVEPNSAAAACQMQLKQRTPLPQLDRTREHYLPYTTSRSSFRPQMNAICRPHRRISLRSGLKATKRSLMPN